MELTSRKGITPSKMENNNEVIKPGQKMLYKSRYGETIITVKRVRDDGHIIYTTNGKGYCRSELQPIEQPESKEPQKQQGCAFDEEAFNPDSGAERSHTNFPTSGKRSAEQTYSIEEAANDLIRETFGNFTECQQQILVSYVDLLDFAKEAAKLSKIKDSKNKQPPY